MVIHVDQTDTSYPLAFPVSLQVQAGINNYSNVPSSIKVMVDKPQDGL